MMDYKIILVAPFWEDEWYKIETGSRELLGLQYLAACLSKENIPYQLLNAYARQITNKDVADYILNNDYQFVAISCLAQRSYPATKELIDLLDKRGFKGHICLGGNFPTLKFKRILEDIHSLDTIVLGEGEYTLPILIKEWYNAKRYYGIKGIAYKNQGKIKFTYPERIEDLDKLPFPIRDTSIVNKKILGSSYSFRLIAGRGCYGQCRFCCSNRFFRKNYRIYRSVNNFVDEIEFLMNQYDAKYFWFSDDIFYDSSPEGIKWVNSFVAEVKSRKLGIIFNIMMRVNDISPLEILKLKSIGLNRLFVGVESGVPRILKELNKNINIETSKKLLKFLKECGFNVVLGWIAIVPTMSFEELKENYNFLFETEFYTARNIYNKLNVYSGCQYEALLKKKGLLIPSKHFFQRHNYCFKDSRVHLFSGFIDETRKIFLKCNKLIWEIEKQAMKTGKYSLLNLITGEYAQIWKKSVNLLISDIERHQMQIDVYEDKYFKYIKKRAERFVDKIHHLLECEQNQ